ncbi:MAG: hypothetical protein J5614_06430 [Paludibacteraceae bacterium]|nr:hypothetical protein [Paludibacteraceae bacterium]
MDNLQKDYERVRDIVSNWYYHLPNAARGIGSRINEENSTIEIYTDDNSHNIVITISGKVCTVNEEADFTFFTRDEIGELYDMLTGIHVNKNIHKENENDLHVVTIEDFDPEYFTKDDFFLVVPSSNYRKDPLKCILMYRASGKLKFIYTQGDTEHTLYVNIEEYKTGKIKIAKVGEGK